METGELYRNRPQTLNSGRVDPGRFHASQNSKFEADCGIPRVIFFQIQTQREKPDCLVRVVQRHFLHKEPILIVAEEDKALSYVDELLWKHPPESFLPHAVLEEPAEEWIAITKVKKNLNQARYAFNLCPTPLLIEGPFRTIYEFEDISSPNKKILSQMRYDAYKQAKYLIESHLSC